MIEGTLRLRRHAHLQTRLRLHYHMEPLTREELFTYLRESLRAVGCRRDVCSDPALDGLFRLSEGIPRKAGNLLSMALRAAHEEGRDIVSAEHVTAASRQVLL